MWLVVRTVTPELVARVCYKGGGGSHVTGRSFYVGAKLGRLCSG